MDEAKVAVGTERQALVVEVVGRRPEHEPYVWMGQADGTYVDSISEDEMRRLYEAIGLALGTQIASR